MSNKFLRNYKLVYTAPATETEEAIELTIKFPLTCEFDINRNTSSQANTATFRIYNLAPKTREKIFQDRYNINRQCFVDFYAGYGDELTLIFTGRVQQAYSQEETPNIITEIQAFDNDIIQSYSIHKFAAGTEKKEVAKALINDFPNLKIGAIGNLEGTLTNSLIVDDKTFVALNKLTGNHVVIDLNQVNILQNNEVLADVSIPKITSETGLLGTPRRRDTNVEADLIFEPKMVVGQLVEIESRTAPIFNGQFKVIGIHHTGTISGAVAGEARTTLNLYIGALIPNSNQIFSGISTYEPLSEVKGFQVKSVDNIILGQIRRIREFIIKNNYVPHERISKNIWWDEVILNYSQQGSVPSLTVMNNLYKVATTLQSFVDKFYPNNKVQINSGWRSSSYNATIPNAHPNSSHIQGYALDFTIMGVPNYYTYQNLLKFWNGRKYLGSGFIHVDITTSRGKIANDR